MNLEEHFDQASSQLNENKDHRGHVVNILFKLGEGLKNESADELTVVNVLKGMKDYHNVSHLRIVDYVKTVFKKEEVKQSAFGKLGGCTSHSEKRESQINCPGPGFVPSGLAAQPWASPTVRGGWQAVVSQVPVPPPVADSNVSGQFNIAAGPQSSYPGPCCGFAGRGTPPSVSPATDGSWHTVTSQAAGSPPVVGGNVLGHLNMAAGRNVLWNSGLHGSQPMCAKPDPFSSFLPEGWMYGFDSTNGQYHYWKKDDPEGTLTQELPCATEEEWKPEPGSAVFGASVVFEGNQTPQWEDQWNMESQAARPPAQSGAGDGKEVKAQVGMVLMSDWQSANGWSGGQGGEAQLYGFGGQQSEGFGWEAGWQGDGQTSLEPIWAPPSDMRAQVPHNGRIAPEVHGGSWYGKGNQQNQGMAEVESEYVEWRRMLVWDPHYQKPADANTFLRLMTYLGMYKEPSDATKAKGTVELSLKKTYGGTLTFYTEGKSYGKITIGQSNMTKKTQIWQALAPDTEECTEKPSKRRKQNVSKGIMDALPTPADFAMGFA